MNAAEKLDHDLAAGNDFGPLHGIPIVVKDNFDTSGIRTTVGSKLFDLRIPTEDAAVIRNLKSAGAVLLGKTNMNELAAGVTGTNEFYGDTYNPWVLDRSPGGSSGGSAAAIAAGYCLGATGTDTGGSIRIPASWCGIAGMRPTPGLISLDGVYPRARSLDVVGPLASTVDDLAVLLDAMVGVNPQRESCSTSCNVISRGATPGKGLVGLRLGVVKNYTYEELDIAVLHSVQHSVETLSNLGAVIVDINLPGLTSSASYLELFNNIMLYEFNQLIDSQQHSWSNQEDLYGPIVRRNILDGKTITKSVYEKTLKARAKFSNHIKSVFHNVDALLTPAQPIVAPELHSSREVFERGRHFVVPFSLARLPSIVVPCGFSDQGLPIGLQVVGNHFQERTILRIASSFERDTSYHRRCRPYFPGLHNAQ